MTTANPILFNPTQLVLELESNVLDRAWQQSQATDNSGSRWQSYLNRIVLETFLPWLQAEEDAAAQSGLTKAMQADLWSVVNGTAVDLQDAKLVLIPSEAEDLSELQIPQEWIDIPELAADYYLAVQVNVDAGFLRVWGYTTHQKVKQSSFNSGDRTYTLSDDELISDLDVLWLARELCPEEVTQAAIEPIQTLNEVQAQNAIQRLGSQSQLLPRLAVPFAIWAALIKNSSLLNELVATRRGVQRKTPVVEWLQQGISNLTASWRQIELTPSVSGARGIATQEGTTAKNVPALGLAKQIAIAKIPYELRILPLETPGSWRFEFCCVTPGCVISPGFKLRLLTEELQNFAGNEDVAIKPVEKLILEVDLDAGESLVCQIESTSDVYYSETLQF